MTRYKKDLPLTVLQTIEPLMNEVSKLLKVGDSGQDLLRIDDSDPRSEFYFKIIKYSDQGQKLNIEFKPMNGNNVDVCSLQIQLGELKPHFTNWKSCIAAYEQVKIFDDPILRQYQEEFENNVYLVDEDADRTTYDLKTQFRIEEYLTTYQQKLNEFKTTDNEGHIEEISKEIEELKNNQTRLTKKKVIERLARIWAKTRKIGLSLLKDVYETTKEEVIKMLISGQFERLG